MKTSLSLHFLQSSSESSRVGAMFFLSVGLHCVAISAMFFLPNLASSRLYYSPVYSVRLVAPTLPAVNEPGSSNPAPAPVSSAPKPAGEAGKPKTKEKPISLAPAKKEDPGKGIAEAVDRIRQRQEGKKIDSAIDRIRSEKESRQVSSAIENIRRRVTIGTSGTVEAEEGSTGGASSGILAMKCKIYYNLIWQRIRSAWVLPDEALRGQKNLETIINIRIAKDGQIEEVQFEKKSGNSYLDESALRAIKKANPLPPLPPGFEGDKFDLGVRFTPSEIAG